MAQWDVGDVVDLLRLYRVPNSALNFVYRHNIDGESMDDGVELIVKDLKLNNLQAEEAIVAKWKEVSDSGLSPQEALKYGTSQLPNHLFDLEDQQGVPDHTSNDIGTESEQVNGNPAMDSVDESNTFAVQHLDGTETIEDGNIETFVELPDNLNIDGNLAQEDNAQHNELEHENVFPVAHTDTTVDDKIMEDTTTGPTMDTPYESTEPEPKAEVPVSVEAEDYGNDFEPDEPAPMPAPPHIQTQTAGEDVNAKEAAEDTYSDFELDNDNVDQHPPPQHHHVHFATPATPPHHHHSVHRVTSNEEIPDLSATIEKQTREYELRRQQRAMQRYDSNESVRTEDSVADAVARQSEEAGIKYQLEKYQHEMVQQSELLRLQEERIKLQDLLLQKQRSTIATLSPRGHDINSQGKEQSHKTHKHAGRNAGEAEDSHDLYNYNINYEPRDHYADNHAPAFERYPPNLLYDNISQLSGSEVFDTPVNYSIRQAAQMPLVDSSITSVNSSELEQNNRISLHYGYENGAGLYPQENYHHIHLDAGTLERMEPFAPPTSSRSTGKRPVSGSVLRTPTAPAPEFPTKQGHRVGQMRPVYSAGNKRRDSAHRADEAAQNNMHRELYQGSTDSAGNVWHHHREPAVAPKPAGDYPLRDRVFVPQLPLTNIALPAAPIDAHPEPARVRQSQKESPVRRAQSPPQQGTNNRHPTSHKSKDTTTNNAPHQEDAGHSTGAPPYAGAPVEELVSLIKELSECNRALLQAIRPYSAPSIRRPTAQRLTVRAEPLALTSRTTFSNTVGNPATSDPRQLDGHVLKQQYEFADQQLQQADHSPGSHRMSSQGNSPVQATAGGVRYTTEQAIAAIIKKLHDSPYRSRPSSSAGTKARPKSSNGVRSRKETNNANTDGSNPPVSASRVQEYIDNLVLELTAKDAARKKGSLLHAPPPQFVYVPQGFNKFPNADACQNTRQAIASGDQQHTNERPYFYPQIPKDIHPDMQPGMHNTTYHDARGGPETPTEDAGLLEDEHTRVGAPPRSVLLLRNGSGTIRDGPTYLRPRARDAKVPAASSATPSTTASATRPGTSGSTRGARKVRATAEPVRGDIAAITASCKGATDTALVDGAVPAPPPAKALRPKKPASSMPSGRNRQIAGGRSAGVHKVPEVPSVSAIQ